MSDLETLLWAIIKALLISTLIFQAMRIVLVVISERLTKRIENLRREREWRDD